MAEEALVFRGQYRLDQWLRQFVVSHWLAAFFPVFCDQLHIATIDAQGDLVFHLANLACRGQLGSQIEVAGGEGCQAATGAGNKE